MIELAKKYVAIPKDERGEHDGIMEQITFYLSRDGGHKEARWLRDTPWRYVEVYCRLSEEAG